MRRRRRSYVPPPPPEPAPEVYGPPPPPPEPVGAGTVTRKGNVFCWRGTLADALAIARHSTAPRSSAHANQPKRDWDESRGLDGAIRDLESGRALTNTEEHHLANVLRLARATADPEDYQHTDNPLGELDALAAFTQPECFVELAPTEHGGVAGIKRVLNVYHLLDFNADVPAENFRRAGINSLAVWRALTMSGFPSSLYAVSAPVQLYGKGSALMIIDLSGLSLEEINAVFSPATARRIAFRMQEEFGYFHGVSWFGNAGGYGRAMETEDALRLLRELGEPASLVLRDIEPNVLTRLEEATK